MKSETMLVVFLAYFAHEVLVPYPLFNVEFESSSLVIHNLFIHD